MDKLISTSTVGQYIEVVIARTVVDWAKYKWDNSKITDYVTNTISFKIKHNNYLNFVANFLKYSSAFGLYNNCIIEATSNKTLKYIDEYGNLQYSKTNGRAHNLDGPAVIFNMQGPGAGTALYYIDEKELKAYEFFELRVSKTHNKAKKVALMQQLVEAYKQAIIETKHVATKATLEQKLAKLVDLLEFAQKLVA